MSVGTMGNKGEKQYHRSCNGRSDILMISTSTAMGPSSSSAMDNLMMGASQTQIKGEEKEQQRKNKMVSSFFSHNGQIYIYIYI